MRSKVQVSRAETGKRGTDSYESANRDTRSTRHDANLEPKTRRSPDQLGHWHHSIPFQRDRLATGKLRLQVNQHRVQHVLDRIARDYFTNNTDAILRVNNSVKAFGKYTITKSSRSFQVYDRNTLAAEPSSNRIALCWCVADKYGHHNLAQRLLTLDSEVERRRNEIEHYRHTLHHSQNPMLKSVVYDRLDQSRDTLKHVQEHLEECVNLAKYLHIRGFNNETARTIVTKTQSANY